MGIVLGVDPGLATTGWGVVGVDGKRFQYLESGKITSTPKQPMGRRLERIFAGLQQVIETFGVTGCAVESGYVGVSAMSALLLGQARAAAILAAETKGIPVETVAPREIKMAITGRGAATKAQVGYMTGKLLGLEFDEGEEDISDALAAALWLVMRSQHPLTMRPAR
ncbi:MAG TPA: crossover junction endodeoxyribonuclease RuvC [bacterium]|jgi:crossover junction endodeoxyribonuclease RuvC